MQIKPAYNDIPNLRQLFIEYTSLLVELEPLFQDYLNMQDFDNEMENIAQKYAPPQGRLYIAYVDGQAAGCVALLPINEIECEMKRLYVRPQYGRLGIGRALAKEIICAAREIGYKYMLLDTFPALYKAVTLYESMGFYRIPAYNSSPIEGTVYMKMDL